MIRFFTEIDILHQVHGLTFANSVDNTAIIVSV